MKLRERMVVFPVVAGLLSAAGCDKPAASTPAGGTPAAATRPAASNEPPITVSAENLAKEFKADAAAADRKYKDRILIVEGKVHDVYGKEISNEPTLVLWGYQEKPTEVPKLVQCFFVPQLQEKVASYKKDQKVRVKGKAAGSIDTLHYRLVDCVFVE